MSASPSIAAPTLGFAVLLAALATVGPFSIDTYLPALPEMGETLGVDVMKIQQTLSIYLLSFGLMTLWHGALSDSFGRRRVILIGIAAYACTALGCALAPNIETLWVMRGLQGLAAGSGMVVSRAMVRDLYQGATAQRLMSHIAIMFAVAPAIAPMIGGWLLELMHWRAIFAFLTLASGMLWFFCWRHLPESLPVAKREPFAVRTLLAGYERVMGSGAFLLISIGTGMFFGAFFLYILAAPIFIREHLGLSATDFHWLFVPVTLGMVAGSLLCGRTAGHWNDARTLIFTFGIMGAAALANLLISRWLPENRVLAILPLAVYNMGVAFAMPVVTLRALDLFPENRRGMAASCQSFLMTIANSAIAEFLVPRIWHSRVDLALGMLILCGASIILVGFHFLHTKTDLPHRQTQDKPGKK
jgi:DHA1 family bicyclomycin/chloramphenicol resistance-like MFS transporter